ncbi:MAG: hypothetical protein V3V37_02090, partial [Candidatus Adiutricales bacterium]
HSSLLPKRIFFNKVFQELQILKIIESAILYDTGWGSYDCQDLLPDHRAACFNSGTVFSFKENHIRA